jgi:AraC family transcriptional regulator
LAIKLKAGEFYGETSRIVTQAGFSFIEKAYQPRLALSHHAHELAHFCFVLSGSYTEMLRNKKECRVPGTLIFYPPDITHSEVHYTSGRHFLIEVQSWRAESMREYVGKSELTSVVGGPTGWLTRRLYEEFRHMDDLSRLALEGIVLELMVETLRSCESHTERPPKWLDQAKEILQSSFSDPPSLSPLATAVGVHPIHLARVFRKFQHCTIGEYTRQLRIECARNRMIASDESLAEIALSVGFADQSHFSRSFKRVTGMSPSEFRWTLRRS